MNWVFISLKTAFFIVIAVKTSNLTYFLGCSFEEYFNFIYKKYETSFNPHINAYSSLKNASEDKKVWVKSYMEKGNNVVITLVKSYISWL
jgi:hypothetical protein